MIRRPSLRVDRIDHQSLRSPVTETTANMSVQPITCKRRATWRRFSKDSILEQKPAMFDDLLQMESVQPRETDAANSEGDINYRDSSLNLAAKNGHDEVLSDNSDQMRTDRRGKKAAWWPRPIGHADQAVKRMPERGEHEDALASPEVREAEKAASASLSTWSTRRQAEREEDG